MVKVLVNEVSHEIKEFLEVDDPEESGENNTDESVEKTAADDIILTATLTENVNSKGADNEDTDDEDTDDEDTDDGC